VALLSVSSSAALSSSALLEWGGESVSSSVSHTSILSLISFGQGASKCTNRGGIFDLNMYVTFDCAGIAAF
jgi:hypothetical protein